MGTYLGWLSGAGGLAAQSDVIDGITPEAIQQFAAVYAEGRSPLSVATTLRGIAYVARAVRPPDGLAWLTRVAHRLTNSARPIRAKLPRMADAATLSRLGDELMRRGKTAFDAKRKSGAVDFRDGLMIALLIARPIRRRNLTELRIGDTLVPTPEGYRIKFDRAGTKTGREIDVLLPPALHEAMGIYINEIRPVLFMRATGPEHGQVWVGRRGRPLTDTQISARVAKVTHRELGRAISPHLFRDCAATEIAQHDPEHVGITRSVLGHARLSSSQKFYNQADSMSALRRHGEVIAKLRKT